MSYMLQLVESLYKEVATTIPPELRARYERRLQIDERELWDLFKELYRYAGLASVDDPRRYERVDDVEEVVVDDVETVEGEEYEAVEDTEEVLEDDEYVGQRVVRKRWLK